MYILISACTNKSRFLVINQLLAQVIKMSDSSHMRAIDQSANVTQIEPSILRLNDLQDRCTEE